jgi:hypothetical protein
MRAAIDTYVNSYNERRAREGHGPNDRTVAVALIGDLPQSTPAETSGEKPTKQVS